MPRQAADRNEKLPERYWRYMAGWIVLGTWAFIAFVTVFYLMVAKPY